MALILFVVTSCGKDSIKEYDPDYVISFRPAISIPTRSTQTSSVYPLDTPFKVWAYASDLENGQKSGTVPLKLDGAVVTYQDGVWMTQDRTHWGPESERLTFLAFSPASLNAGFDSASGVSIHDFDVLTDTVDILYSDPIKDQDKLRMQGVVAVPFKHALTVLELRAISGMDESVTFRVRDLTIGDVYHRGDFSSIEGWSLHGDLMDLVLGKDGVDVSDKESCLGKLKVLPQSTIHPVTLRYDLYQYGRLILEDVLVEVSPIKTQWQEGRHYVYTMRLAVDGVTYKTDILDR